MHQGKLALFGKPPHFFFENVNFKTFQFLYHINHFLDQINHFLYHINYFYTTFFTFPYKKFKTTLYFILYQSLLITIQ
jgi:hypothetical protein